MTIAGHLVWLPGLLGFEPQKWPASYMPTHDMPTPIARHPLGADEYRLTIAILAARYPAPVVAETPKVRLEGAAS